MSLDSILPTLISAVPGGVVVLVMLWIVDKMNRKDDAREVRHAADRQAADKEREERNRTHAAERQAMESAYRQLATEVTNRMGDIQRDTVNTVKQMEAENRQAVNVMWRESLGLHETSAKTTLAMSKEVGRLAAELSRMGQDVTLIKAAAVPIRDQDGVAVYATVSRHTHHHTSLPPEGDADPGPPPEIDAG